ncbi:hypothetical protein [Neomegalonema perideroedes]|uniref:hypothetical protein n=1 Tax=Neomegalonema perideroedes TaxID=217219 RepID=UPI000362C73C|nr:hypothetical protein [Neomegalonema perideroedes]
MSRISAALASALMLLALTGAGLAQTPDSEEDEEQEKSCLILDCEEKALEELRLCRQSKLPSGCALSYAKAREQCLKDCSW